MEEGSNILEIGAASEKKPIDFFWSKKSSRIRIRSLANMLDLAAMLELSARTIYARTICSIYGVMWNALQFLSRSSLNSFSSSIRVYLTPPTPLPWFRRGHKVADDLTLFAMMVGEYENTKNSYFLKWISLHVFLWFELLLDSVVS